MFYDFYSSDHDLDAIISKERLFPAHAESGRPAVTGMTMAPVVYDYIFSDDMLPHHVEEFMKATALASLMEIMEIRADRKL